MNYKQMLEKFAELEVTLKQLEYENKSLRERVAILESDKWFYRPIGPGFTPGTIPQPWGPPYQIWCQSDTSNPQDGFK